MEIKLPPDGSSREQPAILKIEQVRSGGLTNDAMACGVRHIRVLSVAVAKRVSQQSDLPVVEVCPT
jgi:hypothetical protein